MNKSFKYISAALLCALALNACKKDEETASYLALNGSFSIPVPRFIDHLSTEEFVLRPGGVSRKDGGAVGYFFKTPYTVTNDTTRYENDPADITGEYVFKLESDTLGTFTIQAGAFAQGYSTSYATATYTTVDSRLNVGSLKGFDTFEDDGILTDPRDSRSYRYTNITAGGKTLSWMRQNLAWPGCGIPFYGYEAMNDIYGRFYTGREAEGGICPEGWRLPDVQEWQALHEEFGNTGAFIDEDMSFNGNRLWSYRPEIEMTNLSRLSVLSCGYAVRGEQSKFSGYGEYTAFLTSDRDAGGKAVYVYMATGKNTVFTSAADNDSFACTVRCVRDE